MLPLCPPADDVELLFARSSGPGGQNVNKLNTKVDMRLDLDKQEWIPDEVKDEIKRKVRGWGSCARREVSAQQGGRPAVPLGIRYRQTYLRSYALG